MATVSTRSMGMPRSWWATRRGRTALSRKLPVPGFHTTARRAWRDSDSTLPLFHRPDGPVEGTPVMNPSDTDLERADGCGHIVVSCSPAGTRITDVFQRAPIRIAFPAVAGAPVEEAVLINTTGGIAGGDWLEWAVTAMDNASIAVTSQAAERVYRALDQPARVTTRLTAHSGARLAWLPQETIVFNSARIHRATEVELSSGAELLALEWMVLGRSAHGEQVVDGQIRDSWRVRKDDRLIWADGFRIAGEAFPRLRARA